MWEYLTRCERYFKKHIKEQSMDDLLKKLAEYEEIEDRLVVKCGVLEDQIAELQEQNQHLMNDVKQYAESERKNIL